MRLFLLALFLIGIVVCGCSDGKFNLTLYIPESENEPEPPKRSSTSYIPVSSSEEISSSSLYSSSEGETPSSSSGEEEIPSSSSTEILPSSSSSSLNPSSSSSSEMSSSSRGNVRYSSSKGYEDYPILEPGAPGTEYGWATRYWDACKPHCSWLSNIGNPKPWSICKTCDKGGINEISTYYPHPDNGPYYFAYLGTKSSCEGGEAYTCFDMAPIAINDTLAYGFAAMNPEYAECGTCYLLEFDGNWYDEPEMPRPTHRALKGKKMIVKASNIGHDVKRGQFDIMIPGGGVGAFNAFSGQLGINRDELGITYGGLLSNCIEFGLANMGIRDGSHRATLEQWQTCLRNECNRVFNGKDRQLLNGCLWQVDWFMAADNPRLYYTKVPCPKYLDDKYVSSIDTEPPPLPDPYTQCFIDGGGADCKSTGWYD